LVGFPEELTGFSASDAAKASFLTQGQRLNFVITCERSRTSAVESLKGVQVTITYNTLEGELVEVGHWVEVKISLSKSF
jgi:hypothetical protein